MNFLAHLHLSNNESHLMVGNFITDFIRGKSSVAALPEGVQKGVQLHRKIDQFTDAHPAVKQSIARLKPAQGAYSPVLMDVFYDYLLVKHWATFSTIALPSFTQKAYSVLLAHEALYPLFLQKRLPLMVQDNWLMRYGEADGLRFVFKKMAQRTKYPNQFERATDDLMALEIALEADFLAFFPELQANMLAEIRKL